MAISDKDRAFIEEVAEYYRNTKAISDDNGSIRDTAIHFGINRAKVRKILITTGDIRSDVTERAVGLKAQGYSTVEIAMLMNMSQSTISTYLPYDNLFYGSDDVSDHAKDVRGYRAYEREQKERQKRLIGVKGDGKMRIDDKDTSYTSKMSESENIVAGAPFRVHMELVNEYPSDDETRVLREFGGVKYGDTICRDIIVPYDIPLYALHFAIQRAFGWQNSHLHEFRISEDRVKDITDNNASLWSQLVGVLFRSPLMNEVDEFWADDYDGGSVKNWLRRKYTGPYMSLCHGEGIIPCHEDMLRLDMEEEYYMSYGKEYNHSTGDYDGEEYLYGVYPVFDHNGTPIEPRRTDWDGRPLRVEKRRFKDISAEGLFRIFDRYPFAILERLPLYAVIGKSMDRPIMYCKYDEVQRFEDTLCSSGATMCEKTSEEVKRIIESNIDLPEHQIIPPAFSDRLLYYYDFGDGWQIEITASEGCTDLIESGRISQTELDKAISKCKETYRPVLIARDGEDLIDDVGGVSGFIDFLKTINPRLSDMSTEEKEDAKREKEEYIEWAKMQGWKRNARVRLQNLL